MPKYGMAKYKTFKYGRYLAVKPAVQASTKYRLRTNGSNIVTQKLVVEGKLGQVRVRSNDSSFTVSQKISIVGLYTKVRIKTNDSGWIVFTKVLLESEG